MALEAIVLALLEFPTEVGGGKRCFTAESDALLLDLFAIRSGRRIANNLDRNGDNDDHAEGGNDNRRQCNRGGRLNDPERRA